MKASTLVFTLLLLVTLSGLWPRDIAARSGPGPTTAEWPSDSTVRVYFVRGLFTSEQTETLWKALETWTQNANRRSLAVRFAYAGQTNGLIDCLVCLTLSRQEAYLSRSRRASFNSLRHNETGQLISAWIGFDNAVTNPRALRELMLDALERGPGILR